MYAAIDTVREKTVEEQKKWFEERFNYLSPLKKPFSPPQQRHTTFGSVGATEHNLHLSAGNFMEMKDIDVFVNSENAYMQMARFFEPASTSGMLRYRGASFDQAGNLKNDTIQSELSKQLEALDVKSLPLAAPRVIVTSAGREGSRLRVENGARYIFHAATVFMSGVGDRKDLIPIKDESALRKITRDTLECVYKVDQEKGVISPKGTQQWEMQSESAETYEKIRSILIPLFTTGRGGQSATYVASIMTTAILDYLIAEPGRLALKDIYTAVYIEQDVDPVVTKIHEIFKERFG